MAKKQDVVEKAKAVLNAEEVIPLSSRNVHQRMLGVMEDFRYIQKTGEASYGDRYKFVSHDDITSQLHPLLVKHGLTWVPTVTSVKYDRIETKRGPSMHTQVFVDICVRNVDKPSDFVVFGFAGNAITNDDKGIGIATTYALKVAMLKVFAIPSGEADLEDRNEEIGATPEDRGSTRREVPKEADGGDDGKDVANHKTGTLAALTKMKVPKGSMTAAISYFANEVGVTLPEPGESLSDSSWHLIFIKAKESSDSGLGWADIKAAMIPA